MEQNVNEKKSPRKSRKVILIAAICALAVAVGLGTAALLGAFGGGNRSLAGDVELCAAS